MRLTIDKLYGEIVVLMTYCATGNVEYLSSTECANRFKNILETIKEYKNIEKNLGFGLNELVQMLINGIWEVGAVDSETMLPVSQGITHFYIYEIDFDNKKIKVFHKAYKETLFDELDLNKYKQKCLSGWALTKEELL